MGIGNYLFPEWETFRVPRRYHTTDTVVVDGALETQGITKILATLYRYDAATDRLQERGGKGRWYTVYGEHKKAALSLRGQSQPPAAGKTNETRRST